MEELFELTVNNYKQPTTLPLRTYYLTTILPLRTQGALKEDRRNIYEWDLVGCMGEIQTHVWVRHRHLYGWDTSIAVGEQMGSRRIGLVLTLMEHQE